MSFDRYTITYNDDDPLAKYVVLLFIWKKIAINVSILDFKIYIVIMKSLE